MASARSSRAIQTNNGRAAQMMVGRWAVNPVHKKRSGFESHPSHNYGDCSSVGRVEDCGSFGHGFDPHHSPEIKMRW